jgi:hypothetical protein
MPLMSSWLKPVGLRKTVFGKSKLRHWSIPVPTYLLTIDESIKTQLGLIVKEMREIELADGSRLECEIVSPVDLYFENRATTCRALVLPGATEVLLGAIPLEDLDVL